MVAQVGLTSVGPVSSFTGIANPAWATTNKEIRNSGGSTTNKTECIPCSNSNLRQSFAQTKVPHSSSFHYRVI
ncbi:ash family protein [Escherichia coli]|uniref:ash family protein n=1 Tax=Escherichia coli TaxID=562 RepID=UPI00388D2AC0